VNRLGNPYSEKEKGKALREDLQKSKDLSLE